MTKVAEFTKVLYQDKLITYTDGMVLWLQAIQDKNIAELLALERTRDFIQRKFALVIIFAVIIPHSIIELKELFLLRSTCTIEKLWLRTQLSMKSIQRQAY